jgi:Flp pilus assembly protein TadG
MIAGLSSRVRDLWTDTRGVAATEFAIVMPFMLVLYVGGVELGNGLAMSVKVSQTAHSVADMVSQNTQVTASQMQSILQASTAIMAPYPVADGNGVSLMTITISEVSTDSSGNATVQWSKSTSSSGARPVGQQMTLSSFTAPDPNNPNNSNNANISLILGEVSYAYTPNLGYSISGTVTLSDSYYLFPRCSTNSPSTSSFPYYDVKYPATATCTCIQHLQQKTC